MFRKRLKLKSGNANELTKGTGPGGGVKSQRRKKPSLIDNYEDDEEFEHNLNSKPQEGLKRAFKKISSNDIPSSAAEVDTQYEIPYSAPARPQILNLENMSEEEQNDEDFDTSASDWKTVPSESEIETIRKRRAILQEQQSDYSGTGFYASKGKMTSKENERSYVKLLSRDDKQDLLDVIGDGRKVDQEDSTTMPVDTLPSGFEDSRLALSEGELQKDEMDRRRAILSAINDAHVEDEWETQQIGKTDNNSVAVALPIPYQGKIDLESVVSALQDHTLKVQAKKKILVARKVSLETQKNEFLREKDEMVIQLQNLSVI
ncbi:Ntr2p LALA0_S08e06722g [Lachancea lanzarotensis]|uniref:LALA0S08e06722g1_1 n=1 Tax=Lachancea lanzarotensis TaxID=1245769 RepID=A0A0C7N6U8_9SACH|nr:uncharacterized protein LALA0_S08e06722g [Lachancea lanzarotensis]CEP63617.1 LALA0S08e06722g1_1 [Lachancea lanzarotensis]